jgi:hypothetical protein
MVGGGWVPAVTTAGRVQSASDTAPIHRTMAGAVNRDDAVTVVSCWTCAARIEAVLQRVSDTPKRIDKNLDHGNTTAPPVPKLPGEILAASVVTSQAG